LHKDHHDRVRLILIGIAHDLLAWTQRLLLTGELATCEPSACTNPDLAAR
jgi:hypothetical protein